MKNFSKEDIDRLVLVPELSPKGLLKAKVGGWVLNFVPLLLIFPILILSFISIDRNIKIFLIFILISFALFWTYLLLFKFNQIKLNEYKFEVNGLKEKVSFIFLSDLHISNDISSTGKERLQKIINIVNSTNSELVLFGGDYVHEDYDPEVLKMLGQIKAKYKFGVYGNHDDSIEGRRIDKEYLNKVLEILESCDIKVLLNDGVRVEVNNSTLFVGGIVDLFTKEFDFERAFENYKNEDVKILLSHNPDVIDFIKDEDGIDLILSGHTHSGQIFIPGIGPILPMPNKYKWLNKGVFNVGKRTKLLLSQGVGHGGTRIRLGTTSEVCLIELSPKA